VDKIGAAEDFARHDDAAMSGRARVSAPSPLLRFFGSNSVPKGRNGQSVFSASKLLKINTRPCTRAERRVTSKMPYFSPRSNAIAAAIFVSYPSSMVFQYQAGGCNL